MQAPLLQRLCKTVALPVMPMPTRVCEHAVPLHRGARVLGWVLILLCSLKMDFLFICFNYCAQKINKFPE
jgi:hypothetical protein